MLVSLPYVFTSGTPAYAAQVNANFTAVANGVNSIDASNIGAAGLYASQIIPTTSGQASFGGTQQYAFPAAAGVSITGPLTAGSINAATIQRSGAYLPPVYSAAGAGTGPTEHIIRGSVTLSFTTQKFGSATINLSGSAVFTGISTYQVLVNISLYPVALWTQAPSCYATRISGTQFSVNIDGNANAGTPGNVTVDFVAIGT